MKIHKYWFKPKKYGYGASPTTIEGWLLLLLFIISVFITIIYLIQNKILFFIALLILSSLIIFISKIKTKGDWKWRWG
ncbi:MAG: hypothetical protein ACOC16_00005 [Nanoarchaeota archaeon]